MGNSKHLNKIVVPLIILFSFITILSSPINNLDELWQYSFSRNIASGMTPYVDFNIIVTPLFSFLGAIFLTIFGDELIIMRMFTGTVLSLIIILAYYLFVELKIPKLISAMFTFILLTLFSNGIAIDYNCMTLLICEISLLLELKTLHKPINKKYEILKAIIIGCAIITKQTIGIFLCIIYILYKAIWIKNKLDFKHFMHDTVYRIIGISIPVVLFIIYLIYSNSLNEFFNYCILGVSEFSNTKSYFKLFTSGNIILILLALLVPINTTYNLIKIKKLNKENYILTVFSITMLIGLFPIADVQHFVIYAFLGFISLFYTVYDKILKDLFYVQKQIKALLLLILFALLLYTTGIILNIIHLSNNYKLSELKHYSYCLISKDLEQEIKNVENYIIEKEKINTAVLILDSTASLFMIPLNQYNKDYDLFMNGNFGKDGNTKLIKDIINRTNTEILILNNKYDLNWQTPTSVLNYVIDNYIKTNEIERFDIYIKFN